MLLLLSCRSSLYTQNIYSLSGICSTNIFSCSVGYIFILFILLGCVVTPFGSLGERDSGRWLSGATDEFSGHFQISSTVKSALSGLPLESCCPCSWTLGCCILLPGLQSSCKGTLVSTRLPSQSLYDR